MRSLLLVALLASSASANEVIEIHDRPVEPAHTLHRVQHPPYSAAAIEANVWTRAWMLLEIDSTGFVTRLKVLDKPGYDLDEIAVSEAFKTRFTPARDRGGHAVRSQLIWSLEWPSYYWKMQKGTRAPCAGSGPLPLGTLMTEPVYSDCREPSVATADHVAWTYPRAATTNFK